jgi:uroporphyrinogen decarboxylase
MLNDEVPLIGFAGSPWTIMCYAVEGQGSKSFDKAKDFVFTSRSSTCFITKNHGYHYFIPKRKSKKGRKCRSNFDSWGGMLSHLLTIKNFHGNTSTKLLRHWLMMPGNCFRKGCWFALGEMGKSRASALGVDWTCSPRNARYLLVETLQGNFDPSRLLSPFR